MSQLTEALRHYIDLANEGQVTCVTDLANFHSIDPDELNKYFRSPRITHLLLTEYDLPVPPLKLSRRSLTTRQKKWITAATNPYTSVGIAALAAQNGVSMEEHRRWMKQQAFRDEYNKALKDDVNVTQGEILRKAANRALSGDPKAVELIYRLTGKPLAAATNEAEASGKVAIGFIVEVLQRHLDSNKLSIVAGELMMGPQTQDFSPDGKVS